MNATLNRKFWALINHHGINADQKDGIVWDYTGGRTHHSSELTDEEATGLIRNLQAMGNRGKTWVAKDPCDNIRKQLIAMSYSIGEDLDFVKGWCEKYGIYGEKKRFNSYSVKELIGLREKFRKVVKDREQAVCKV